ncbi:MAG: FAD-dependent oxidoreductase [Acidimicrobiia bacterium]
MIPDRAQVVVVGGGIAGCSIAYHLAKRGVSDVVVLEQNQLTGGTTWHAAGLVTQLKSSRSLTTLATYTTRLIASLETETGQATGYRNTGSILVASDAERWEEIMRGLSMARTVGVEMAEISIGEAKDMWPLLNTDDLVGAAFIPGDGVTSPVDTTMALAKGARDRGVTIVEGVAVTSIRVEGERATGVETEQGYIEAETVVLAAGIWTRHLAATAGVNVPLQACEHFYVVTEPIDGLSVQTPVLRDPTNHTYFKEETGKIMAGFFEPRGKVWKLDGIPRDFSFGTLGEDWDHIGPIFQRSMHRVPALRDVGIQLLFNGPEAFTPDGVYYIGESPEVDGLFVAAGFNSVGIQSAGGVGWVLADWIIDGDPPMDLWPVDVRRTMSFQADPAFLEERIPESLGLLYAMHWPHREYESGRDVKMSPLHQRLEQANAVFGSMSGWERPNWYAVEGQRRSYEYSFGKQNWFENTGEECRATRNAVALFDQASFVKFDVRGPDALAVLNHMSSGDIDAPVGKVVYTQWLNHRGGIEADLTVTRLGEDRFMVVSGAGAPTRDWAHLRRSCRGHDVSIRDITTETPMIGVMGPNSRPLLSTLTDAPLDNKSFPFGTAQRITVAGHDLLALRVTYVGELGWELYVRPDDAVPLFDALLTAGEDYGLTLAGYHAMNSLRLEAGYRHWGHDISDEDTPLEAGLGFAVSWEKPGGFVGREALLRQKGMPRSKRLIQFRLEDPDLILYHDEPILRNGELVGRTTSGAWSYTEDRCLAMGYVNATGGVTREFLDRGDFEIEVAGNLIPATASIRSFYDPGKERVRV